MSIDDFPVLFQRTEEEIRADFDARANAGVTPDDPAWTDTRAGVSSFWLFTQPAVVEFAAAYDRMNEIAAASILSTSWGEFLDAHVASFGDERIAAVRATGVLRFEGAEGTLIANGARFSPVQTDPDLEPPVFQTTEGGTIDADGVIDLPAEALEAGEAGNVAAGTITYPRTAVPGVVTITNPDDFDGGEEEESDDALKTRMRLRFKGGGGGNAAAYAREALLWPGVGFVKVIPHWNGPGTVKVVIMDNNRDPLPSQVAPLQEHLGTGVMGEEGWAGINHEVTVVTPDYTDIYGSSTVVFAPGYSLDGAGGTVALRSAIEAATTAYIDSLAPGDDVIFEAFQAAILSVDNVVDVADTTVDVVDPPVGTANIAIDDDHVARLVRVDLV